MSSLARLLAQRHARARFCAGCFYEPGAVDEQGLPRKDVPPSRAINKIGHGDRVSAHQTTCLHLVLAPRACARCSHA